MGYHGYKAAKLPPPPPTAVQAALWAVTSQESLDVIGKLTKNVVVSPTEEKFRRVRLSNDKIKATLVNVEGAIDALVALGWAQEGGDEDPVLVVPKGRHFSMAEVRLVEEAKERLRKREKEAARSKASRTVPGDTAAARILEQMEADRRERASREPVTKGSTARSLGSGTATPVTPKDIGIGDSCEC